MAFPLHSRPLYIRYHANRISCASFCTFLYLVCLIVLPYILTFALGGMWTKEVLVREQPKVNFRYEVLMEATAVTDVAVASKPIVPLAWSTSQELNDALRDTLRPCSLRTWEEDDELDGFPDRLQLALSMPVDADNGERVLAASVVVGVSVTFVTEFKLTMNASVVLEASSPLPGRLWEQTADLELRSNHAQRSLDLVARDPCPAPTWAFARPQLETGGPATASSILAQYAKCNDTVIAAARTPPLWTPGIDENFEARLTLRIPPMLTARRPGCALSPARTPLVPSRPVVHHVCTDRAWMRATPYDPIYPGAHGPLPWSPRPRFPVLQAGGNTQARVRAVHSILHPHFCHPQLRVWRSLPVRRRRCAHASPDQAAQVLVDRQPEVA